MPETIFDRQHHTIDSRATGPTTAPDAGNVPPPRTRPTPPTTTEVGHGNALPTRSDDRLVTIESQREFDLLSGRWEERVFVKMYVAARSSGLLASISDRDWKTLCTLATYMDSDGYCFPSQKELAKALGCSRQMANERVKSLAKFRFRGQPVLSVLTAERDEQGRWARNGYRVLPLANLAIFDDQPPCDRPAEPSETVSSSLDTVENAGTVSSTVSSHTGTVQLDTNYNHRINQNEPDRYHSNLRRVSQPARTEGADVDDSPGIIPDRISNTSAGFNDVATILTNRRRRSHPAAYDEDRQALLAYLEDFAREFSDRAPLKSSVTRCYNLLKRSGLDRDAFIQALYQARAITKERTGSIYSTSKEPGKPVPTFHKMPYFFACLEQVLGLRAPAAAHLQQTEEPDALPHDGERDRPAGRTRRQRPAAVAAGDGEGARGKGGEE